MSLNSSKNMVWVEIDNKANLVGVYVGAEPGNKTDKYGTFHSFKPFLISICFCLWEILFLIKVVGQQLFNKLQQ